MQPIIEIPLYNGPGIRIGAVRWRHDVTLRLTSSGVCPDEYETIVEGGEDYATTTISVRLEEPFWHRPIVTSIRIEAADSHRGITGQDLELRGIDLLDWIEISKRVAEGHINVDQDSAGVAYWRVQERGHLFGTAMETKERRPRMTTERLLKIAETYNSVPSKGIEEIERTFFVSRPTASRYVRLAREAGLVKDRRRNKSN